MLKTTVTSLVFLAFAMVGASWLAPSSNAQSRPGSRLRWEYRILTRPQLVNLDKQDLAAGLNRLGDEGWELVAIEPAAAAKPAEYIFKRPRNGEQIEDLKGRIALAESEVEQAREHLAWAERMLRKGFVSENQVKLERQDLKNAEFILERIKRELKAVNGDGKLEIREKETRKK